MKRFRKFTLLFILLSGMIFSVCDNPFHGSKDSEPYQNKAPETYLFLFVVPDTAAGDTVGIDTTASKQVLHWWGEDSDGSVIGYYYQWDYQDAPVWTSSETDTFYVPIRTDYDQFTFRVWAVDDDSLMDPTPAVQTFPVFNSKPEIEFKIRSNPPAPAGNPDVTAYTFPTRTFIWDVFDPDGVETITKVYYALDDTNTWVELAGTERSITLTGLSAGEHKFFVKAEDVAGAQSPVITFPDPLDSSYPNSWVVKEPVGDVLLVNDFAQDQNLFEVQNYYEQILTNIVGSDGYSTWEIGTASTPVINPQNSLPYATADIRANLEYFKKVIWFSHLGRPNLAAAGLSLTQYMGGGGKVFITNGNEEIPDTTWTFTRIDSVFRLNPGGRLLPGIKVLASLTDTEPEDLLDLELGKLIGNRVSGLIPGSGAQVVYRMEPDSTASVSVPYKGSPAVGIRYNIGSGKSIYFSLPLHFCDGRENMETVIRYILEEEFK
jgi:hypothetical protein